jgi:hypothetical protein
MFQHECTLQWHPTSTAPANPHTHKLNGRHAALAQLSHYASLQSAQVHPSTYLHLPPPTSLLPLTVPGHSEAPVHSPQMTTTSRHSCSATCTRQSPACHLNADAPVPVPAPPPQMFFDVHPKIREVTISEADAEAVLYVDQVVALRALPLTRLFPAVLPTMHVMRWVAARCSRRLSELESLGSGCLSCGCAAAAMQKLCCT